MKKYVILTSNKLHGRMARLVWRGRGSCQPDHHQVSTTRVYILAPECEPGWLGFCTALDYYLVKKTSNIWVSKRLNQTHTQERETTKITKWNYTSSIRWRAYLHSTLVGSGFTYSPRQLLFACWNFKVTSLG